jgi:hypothetical protein
MNQSSLVILSAILTGCAATMLGAIIKFLTSFIRMEQLMKDIRDEIRTLRRQVNRLSANSYRFGHNEHNEETTEIKKW